MLDGLDDIDWAGLTHAYGSAATVPNGLRDLAEGDVNVVDWLQMSINHQGSVYDSTAPTIPFLVEIVESSGDLEVIRETLGLLRSIGMARPASHEHLDRRRRGAARSNPDFDKSAFEAVHRQEEANAYAVQDALSSCAERLLQLYVRMSATDAQVAVTLVIARCYRRAPFVAPRVVALLDREQDPDLRASLWAAYAEIIDGLEGGARAEAVDVLAQAANDDADPLVRAVCLQGYARHRIDAADIRANDAFTDDIASTVDRWETSPWSWQEGWIDRSMLAGDRHAQSIVLQRLIAVGESRSIIDALHLHCVWRDVGDDLLDGVVSFCPDDGRHDRLDRCGLRCSSRPGGRALVRLPTL